MEEREAIVRTMRGAGCDPQTIERAVLLWSGGCRAEARKLLKCERCRLLEEIHARQQRLDDLDYLIYELGR